VILALHDDTRGLALVLPESEMKIRDVNELHLSGAAYTCWVILV
jgi:hypothetical protein